MGIDGINNPSQSLKPQRFFTPNLDNKDVIEQANAELQSAKVLELDTYQAPDVLAKTDLSVAGHEGTMQINSDLTFDVDLIGIGKGTFQMVPDGCGGAKLDSKGDIDQGLMQKLLDNPLLKTALGAAYVVRTLKKGGAVPIFNGEIAKDVKLKIEVGKDKIGFNISGTF